MEDKCELCGLPLGDEAIRSDGKSFCCRGCREVDRTLDGELDEVGEAEANDVELSEDCETVYFRVPEMRCASCEAFLSAKARRLDGVKRSNANFASEMVMVDYDPSEVSPSEIADTLNGAGYTALPPGDDHQGTSRQVGRLLVGGFFGMMTMLWYVLFIYPMYFGVPVENLLLNLKGEAGQYLYFNLLVMSGVVVFYTGWPILRGAWVGLRSTYPNMDVLIALAVLNAFFFSVFTLYQGGREVYFDISVVVVLVVTVARYFESRLKDDALNKIRRLSRASVGPIRVLTEEGVREVETDAVDSGDTVLVRSGETIPVDGVVGDGNGYVDESLVTGESRPVRKEKEDRVLAGSLLREGYLEINVTGDPDQTFIDLLRNRMWEIQSSEFNYQTLADKIAAVFVPAVLLLALLTFLGQLWLGGTISESLLRAMTLLVVSCPCALGLATPMATMTTLEALLDRGVAPRSSGLIEHNQRYSTLVLDKTGTVTEDEMVLQEEGVSGEALRVASTLEARSNHPLARAIASNGSSGNGVEDFREYSGEGVSGTVDGRRVLVGNLKLYERAGAEVPDYLEQRYEAAQKKGSIPVLVGWGNRAREVLEVGERVRDELSSILDFADQNDLGVVMMTGDDRIGLEDDLDHPSVETVFTEVKPEAKVKLVKDLRGDGPVVMVGDGKNDAPALAAADLGIAVGNKTALASSAADLVFVRNELGPLPDTLTILTRSGRRVRQNLAWAFLYNAVAIPAALAGYLNPLIAALAMAASSLMVVLNSRRSF